MSSRINFASFIFLFYGLCTYWEILMDPTNIFRSEIPKAKGWCSLSGTFPSKYRCINRCWATILIYYPLSILSLPIFADWRVVFLKRSLSQWMQVYNIGVGYYYDDFIPCLFSLLVFAIFVTVIIFICRSRVYISVWSLSKVKSVDISCVLCGSCLK